MTPEALEQLISTFSAAWSEPDPQARRALLEKCWAAGGVYADPTSADGLNIDALDAHIGGFLAGNPGATITPQGTADHHHNHIRFDWTLHFANGQEAPGMDYGELSPDGKLLKIVAFF